MQNISKPSLSDNSVLLSVAPWSALQDSTSSFMLLLLDSLMQLGHTDLVISTMRPKAVRGALHAAPSTAAAPTTTRVVGSATPHLHIQGGRSDGPSLCSATAAQEDQSAMMQHMTLGPPWYLFGERWHQQSGDHHGDALGCISSPLSAVLC